MLRVKIPQGVLTSRGCRSLAGVATSALAGSPITTRQNVQLHFVPLAQVEDAMRALADTG